MDWYDDRTRVHHEAKAPHRLGTGSSCVHKHHGRAAFERLEVRAATASLCEGLGGARFRSRSLRPAGTRFAGTFRACS